MRRNINNACLTKDYILSKVSQEAIFAFYTGLDIEVIEECIEKGTLISSPFRVDNHPSFGFRYNNKGKLKAKDFAGYFHGDCFDAAAYVISEVYNQEIDINDKRAFIGVLKHIAYSFRNIIYGKDVDYRVSEYVRAGLNKIKNKKAIIEFTVRDWNKDDINYWSNFGITISSLNTNFVYPVEEYYINKKINPLPKYIWRRDKEPCYAYILGRDSNGIYNVKLYFPNRPHGNVRFITNSSCLEGLIGLELDNYDYIIITKSTKDRIAIQCYLETANLDAILYGGASRLHIGLVNIPSENYRLNQNEYNYLRSKCPNGTIISLMDNDIAGCREAIWLRDTWHIVPFIIPKEYGAKDFAELREQYNIETINMLVNEMYKDINNEQDSEIDWYERQDNALPY